MNARIEMPAVSTIAASAKAITSVVPMSGWEPTSRHAAPPTTATRLSAVVRLRVPGRPRASTCAA
jgi:hypothetical protein